MSAHEWQPQTTDAASNHNHLERANVLLLLPPAQGRNWKEGRKDGGKGENRLRALKYETHTRARARTRSACAQL